MNKKKWPYNKLSVEPLKGGDKMAETIGSLVDKLSIINLKLWHMEDEARRKDVDDSHIADAKRKIDILNQQRNDLIEELDELFLDVISGKKKMKVYRQFKMYNDPKYLKK